MDNDLLARHGYLFEQGSTLGTAADWWPALTRMAEAAEREAVRLRVGHYSNCAYIWGDPCDCHFGERLQRAMQEESS